VRNLAMEGRLQPGVLAAAQKVLANAEKKPQTESNAEVLKVRTACIARCRRCVPACAACTRLADRRASRLAQSLTSVVGLLTATLEAVARLAPKAKLAESLTALDPNLPEERALMLELMHLAFAKEGMVDRVDFVEDMVFFLKSADEQDAGLLAAVAEGRVDLGDMKLEDVMLVRRQGRDRMSAIVDMAAGME
jgi:hypothetical protein